MQIKKNKENEIIKIYFNEKAPVWDEMFTESNENKLHEMAALVDIKTGSTVLDVGTGTGRFVPFIIRKIGDNGRLVCLDLAEEMLKKCQSKGFKGNIEYICGDITCSHLPDHKFDAVICYSSFPHFQDKLKALKEIHRVLKTEGRLFICHTSSRHFINEIHSQIPEVHNDLIPEKDEMQQLLKNAGFFNNNFLDTQERYMVSAEKLKSMTH
jgi:ubiquinone/menaquinone biosynthesis C-methylase UbiE